MYIRTFFPDIHGFTEPSCNDSFSCFQLSSCTSVRMKSERNGESSWPFSSYSESCGNSNPSFFFNRALLSVDSSMLFWMKSNTSPTRWETPKASLSLRNRYAMSQLIFSHHWRMVQQNMSRPAEFIPLLTRPKHGIYPPRGLSSTWWRTTLSTVIYWLRLSMVSLR